MDAKPLRRLKARLLLIYRQLLRQRGLWLRATLCLTIGSALLFAEYSANYDLRFKIRGQQKHDQNVILLLISQGEWERLHGHARSWIRPLAEFTQPTDSFFWSPRMWNSMLGAILRDDPKAVGVTFYFGNNIRRPTVYSHFTDPRVVWGSRLDGEGRPLWPFLPDEYNDRTGLVELKADDDGILRRLSYSASLPHLATRIATELHSGRVPGNDGSTLINFQGKVGVYKRVYATDVINGVYSKGFFKDKIIIIGTEDIDSHLYRTPVGEMSRAEVTANIVDNLANGEHIRRLNSTIAILLLLALLIFSIWIMSSYPQSVALVFFVWVGVAWVALSIWIFDAFYFWTPIIAPAAQLTVTYIVFLSYQLTVKDYINWRLEQQRESLLEVEQLKNNFVSLISHDLKTPIAKIQAICDRLLAAYPEHELSGDFHSLRKESSELHRYIQSILQITRIESRDLKINKESSDINELIEKAIEQVKPLANTKKIKIEPSLEPMFLIEIDSVLIKEVLLNLIENAIKYTPDGGQIQVVSREVDDRVFIEVVDNGPGISEEDQQKIFEKFFRGEKHNMATKGSGLGLYLVKYFIELHGGKVFLESTVGKGTKVGFSLPVSEEIGTDIVHEEEELKV